MSDPVRCHTCDRADCPRLTVVHRMNNFWSEVYPAESDCERHEVDWRARALAAEAALAKDETLTVPQARVRELEKLLATECSLSMHTTNAMLAAQARVRRLEAALTKISTGPNPEELATLDCVRLLARIVREARAALADGADKETP